MKAIRILLAVLQLGFFLGATACRRAPAPDQPIEKADKPSGPKLEGKDLILRKGLEITLVQDGAGVAAKPRKILVENPSGAEGLAFTWRLADHAGSSPESLPSGALPEPGDGSGKMTLANTVDGRRMTLPLFWPGGELFLSNSTAIWLSDKAFDELKKEGKTVWGLGLLDNPLLGPAQGNELIEASLELANRGLEAWPDKKAAAQELKVTDDSADFSLKLNGVTREVAVLEAGNWLARLKILDNAQNPLILEVEVAPETKAANLFFPLSWIRPWLNYRVSEIALKP